MLAKEKLHGAGLERKFSALLLCILLAFSWAAAGAEPEVIMYAADGRTLYVINSEVEAYKAVGWYTEPVTLMYAADGRTLYVINSEVEAYKKVGWYTTRQAAASAFPDLSGYGSGSSVSSQTVSGTVYRGRSGTKYHRATCPTLKRGGAYPMSLSEALSRGRTACKVCKP